MMTVLSVVGAVLLFLLKAVLVVLGLILLLLVLFVLIPISVDVTYEKQQFSAKAVLFGIPISVYPVPKWIQRFLKEDDLDTIEPNPVEIHKPKQTDSVNPPQQTQPQADQQPKEQPQPEMPKAEPIPPVSQSSDQVPPQPTPKPHNQPIKENQSPHEKNKKMNWEKITALLNTAKGAIRLVFRGIWVSLWIRFPIQGRDAADTALAFGKWNARIGGVCAVLANLMQFRLKKLDLIPDFMGEYKGQECVRVKATASILLLLIAAVWTLKELKKHKIF